MNDPVTHAAKFLAIFALIPIIFGVIFLTLPSEMGPPGVAVRPFGFAVLVLAVAFGIYKRAVAACYAGYVLFALALAGVIVSVAFGGFSDGAGSSIRSIVIAFALLIWPIVKIRAAHRALATAH